MKEKILLYIILGSPLIWLVSILMLKDWRHIWKYALINFVVLIAYGITILMTDLIDFGHVEYGLKKLFAFIASVVIHILLGFIFAVGYKLRKRIDTTTNSMHL